MTICHVDLFLHMSDFFSTGLRPWCPWQIWGMLGVIFNVYCMIIVVTSPLMFNVHGHLSCRGENVVVIRREADGSNCALVLVISFFFFFYRPFFQLGCSHQMMLIRLLTLKSWPKRALLRWVVALIKPDVGSFTTVHHINEQKHCFQYELFNMI